MRLSQATLADLPAGIARPDYDRDQPVGIVHFGIGAFHRAHMAWYTDACLKAGERGWMIAGVSLRSASVAQQLNPQDGLYTVTERSAEGASTMIAGAVREVLMAGKDRAAIIVRLASPDCQIASFTVTEKGYCRASDGSLDREQARGGFYPILAEALALRKAAGLPGLTLLSCDNLSHNGRQLRRLLREWLAAEAPDLADWFEEQCTTPDSMVDRIVPATTDADIGQVADLTGLDDHGAVVTEPFSQWVIEDSFAGPRPRWEEHGAQIVGDVTPFETAKLRLLNGAHSAMAYCGLERGHDFVHQAIRDPQIRQLVEDLMLREAAPTIAAAPGQDLGRYAAKLITRFENPALNHRLAQIAMDGSQKVPPRWLEVLAIRQERGQQSPALMTALAAWLRHIRGNDTPVDDPMADALQAAWQEAGTEGIVSALFGPGGLIPSPWAPGAAEVAALTARLARSA